MAGTRPGRVGGVRELARAYLATADEMVRGAEVASGTPGGQPSAPTPSGAAPNAPAVATLQGQIASRNAHHPHAGMRRDPVRSQTDASGTLALPGQLPSRMNLSSCASTVRAARHVP